MPAKHLLLTLTVLLTLLFPTLEVPVSADIPPFAVPQVVANQPPDLVISAIRVSKTTLTPGESFTLFATVKNRGAVQSHATPLAFQRATPNVHKHIGASHVNALSANGSVEVSLRLTAPAQAGVYHYKAYLQITNKHSEWVSITVAPRVVSTQPGIYWGFSEKIRRADFDGSNVHDVVTGLNPLRRALGLTSIAIDIGGRKIYWTQAEVGTETHTGKIQSANLDGTNVRTLLTGLLQPRGLVLDVANRKMYWASGRRYGRDISASSKIQSANLDGSNVRQLLTGLGPIRGMALDVVGRRLYWIDWNKMQSANLDGSNLTQLASGSTSMFGLALDVVGRQMYWTRVKDDVGVVYRADFDGSNVTELVRRPRTVPESIALDVAGGKMYWQSRNPSTTLQHGWNPPDLLRANLDGSNVTELLSREAAGPMANMTLSIPPQTVAAATTQTTPRSVATATTPTPQTNVVQTPQTTAVHIPDPKLRAAVRQEIGNTLTTHTMLNLTYLDAYDLGISDLTGLQHAQNLTELSLWGNSISDTSPLARLRRLTDLDLYDNNISDISPIAGLTKLTTLSLRGNSISDISPLAGLTKLTTLSLRDNSISDISPLARLTKLKRLDLRENPLNAAAINTHIPAIQANGTQVEFDNRTPTTPQPPPSVVSTPQPTGVGTAGSHPHMYWTDWGTAKIQHFDGTKVRDIVTGLDGPWDIVLDVAGGKMYWIDSDKIQSANLDGSNVQDLVTELDRISGLALDIAGGKIYWTNSKGNASGKWDPGKIRWADLDGSNVEDIVTGLDRISGLALDVAAGKIYWKNSIWNVPKGKWDPGEIQSADLDGSNVRDIVTGLYGAGDIALDVASGKMYWTLWEDSYTKIQRADFDGSNVEDIVTEIADSVDSLALDVASGKMYWTSVGPDTPKIQWADLDSSNVEDLVTGLDYPIDIALVIPLQTTRARPTKTIQIHVDAADRPPMYWIDSAAGTLHRLVDADIENLVPSVQNATSLTLDSANDTLYWTEKTSNTTGRIQSANLDGTNVQLVKALTSVPFDIALDAANGKLYLTNAYGKVQRMNFDGSGFQPNLITGLDTLTSLAIDVAAGKLYWTEKTGDSAGNIQSANLDGTNLQLLRDITSVPLDITLNADNGTLYWTNSRGKVQQMNVDGSGFQPNFITGLDTRMNIAVDAVGQQLYLTSPDGKISRRNFSGGGSEEVATGLGNPGALVLADAILDEPKTTANGTMDNAADVNDDGTVNDKDAKLVSDAITNGSTDAKYDVNGDGKVNFDDLQLVLENRDQNPYDINADGTVDDKDASLLTDAITNGDTDAKYDVNNDGNVNFNDLQLVLDNRDVGAAGAPLIDANMKLTAAQIQRIEEQINLLIATGDRSPAAMRTLIYLQQFLAMATSREDAVVGELSESVQP